MASSLNRAQLIGNLTSDPELKQIPSGQSVCSFSVATNRVWKNQAGEKQEQADYHNVVAWGKLAEICGQYLSKGKKIFAEGRLQTRDWEGQDGVRRYRTEIVLENMVMLGAPGAGSRGDSAASDGEIRYEAAPSIMPDARAMNPDEEIKLEDIPF